MLFQKDQPIGEGLIPSRWAPWLVLAISLIATALAAYHLARTAQEKDEVRFANAIQQTTLTIHERMQIYESALRGGAAFFAGSEEITREEFQTYGERLRLLEAYAGIQGFGFTKRVKHEEKEDFIREMRSQYSVDFEITPPGDRAEYFPVTYLMPEDARNRGAIGFDMFSEEVRHRAISSARDSGSRSFTGKVTLVQEMDTDRQAGFLIYTPVYHGGTIPETVEERREKLYGFVYAPFRANDLFSGIFGGAINPPVHFEVYDGGKISPEALLFASAVDASSRPQFSRISELPVPGRRWTLLFRTTPTFEQGSSQFLAVWVLAAGTFLGFTLFGITRALNFARFRAEASRHEAAEQREEYQVTLSSIGDAVIATDLDGKITFMNPVAENMTAWPLVEAPGRALLEVFRIVHEMTGETQTAPIDHALAENRRIPLPSHTMLIGRQGNQFPIEGSATPIRDFNGRLRGAVLVFHDVSAKRAAELRRQRAEKELRDAQSRLESGIQAASIGTWIWDIEENNVFADAQLAEIFSITPQQAAGGPVEDYLQAIHPEDLPRLQQTITNAIERGGEIHEAEYRIPQKDGAIRWFAARGKIERLNTGRSSRFVGAIIDITDRKETEKALAAAKAELENYAKTLEETVFERTARLRESVSELEAFSYSLSHDLRAPLRAIQGFSQILLEEREKEIGAEGIDYLTKVMGAAARMDRLIQDVLSFSRVSRQEIVLENIDVKKLIRSLIHEQPRLQPPEAEITVESPLLPIRGNEASLTQCVTNLLDNAVKFVAPGVQPKVRIRSESIDGQVRLWFEDNGIGMEEEAQKKLFEMFQRIHCGDYPGVGLGLAIVRKAVERMGGQAGVISRPGQGSRFWIQLPGGNEPAE